MSFLIKLSNDQLEDIPLIHQYETELIYSVANMNRIFINAFNLDTSCLGCLGIKYIDSKSKSGYIEIEHISEMLEKGYGKCDSIVAWFIAVYTMNGINAEPVIIPISNNEYHVKLKWMNGNKWEVLDPARDLDKIIFDTCLECKQKMINGTFRKNKRR